MTLFTRHVVEAHQIDVFAFAVLCDFQQVEDAEKSGLASQLGSNVRKADWLDGVDLDLSLVHAVACAHSYARTYPDTDATGDLSATNSVAQPLGEHHPESLLQRDCTTGSIGHD